MKDESWPYESIDCTPDYTQEEIRKIIDNEIKGWLDVILDPLAEPRYWNLAKNKIHELIERISEDERCRAGKKSSPATK